MARQFGHEVNALGAFDMAQPRPDKGDKFGFEFGPGLGHVAWLYHRLHRFAHFGIGNAEHRDVSDFGMQRQGVFGFLRVDVDAARNDHEGGAIGEEQIAVVIDMADIAKGGAMFGAHAGGLGSIIMIFEGAAAVEEDPPGLPRCQQAVIIGQHANFA